MSNKHNRPSSLGDYERAGSPSSPLSPSAHVAPHMAHPQPAYPAYPQPAYPQPAYPVAQPAYPVAQHHVAVPQPAYPVGGSGFPPPGVSGTPQNIHIVVNTPMQAIPVVHHHHHHHPHQYHHPPHQPICPNHAGEHGHHAVHAMCYKCHRGYCYYCLTNRKGGKHEFVCTPCRTKSMGSFH